MLGHTSFISFCLVWARLAVRLPAWKADRAASEIATRTAEVSYRRVITKSSFRHSWRKCRGRASNRVRQAERKGGGGENVKLSGLFLAISPRWLCEILIFSHLRVAIVHLSVFKHTPPISSLLSLEFHVTSDLFSSLLHHPLLLFYLDFLFWYLQCVCLPFSLRKGCRSVEAIIPCLATYLLSVSLHRSGSATAQHNDAHTQTAQYYPHIKLSIPV